MKTQNFGMAVLATGLMFLSGTEAVRSQAAKPSAEQQLKDLKAANAKLLETQAATLQKLDEVLKDAQQLRTFARRT
jgi:hypothetical protein